MDGRPAHLRSLDGGRERLLTVKEVAARLGVCRATAYELCERGELPHIRVLNAIRVRSADVEEFISARRAPRSYWTLLDLHAALRSVDT